MWEREGNDPSYRCRQRRAPVRQGGQRGFTLVETLISLALAGLVVLGLAAGLLTLVRSTASTGESQQVQLVLDNYSESVKAFDYLPCATAQSYDTAHGSWPGRWHPPAGAVTEIVQVEYWHKAPRDASGDLHDGPGEYSPSCPDTPAGPVDDGSQRLTLRVEQFGRAAETQIVKAAR